MVGIRPPIDLTSFVGRDSELDQLAELVGACRLTTLSGGAGAGKTRLALELIRTRLYPGLSVAWVELAALREPTLVVQAIAETVDLAEEVRPGDLEGLIRLLGKREIFLVLDNCEHLVEAVAAVVDGVLRGCPGVTVLATSREALGVRGEQAWVVPPLGLPSNGAAHDSTWPESVRLFAERAREGAPGFELSAEVMPVVGEICRRLDGNPLAIELAAARVRMLQPREILNRLENALPLLTDDRRTATPRHRTLRDAIDWSHELLREPSRILLRRLSVFRGGFTLEAAEAVGPGGPLIRDEVLELVGQLVDRSMLVVREHGGFARYHLLEPVRQYAQERLSDSGEDPEVRHRHAAYFTELVLEAEPHLIGRERPSWVHRLLAEMDNLRSALAWSREAEPELHVRLVGGLWWFWFSTQHWTEGGRWIDGALALEGEPGSDRERAALLFAKGSLATLQVRTSEGRAALDRAVTLAARAGDERLEAYATNYLGMGHAGEGESLAMELCGRAERWFRDHGDLYGLRLALLLQGSTALARGDLNEAERLNREGVQVARRFGLPRELAVSLQNLAAVHIVQGLLDEAEALILEALRTSRDDLSYYFISTGIGYLGEIQGRRSRALEAARLLGAAEALRERVGARPFPLDQERLDALLPGLRGQAGEEAFETAWREGRSLQPEELLDELIHDPAPGGRKPGAGRPTTSRESTAHPPEGAREPIPDLAVEALGGFRVRVDGEAVGEDRWSYGRPRELLIYLLLNPAGETRDRIGEDLWPGTPWDRVKNSFHVTLHHLRKALGRPEWIVLEGGRYRISAGIGTELDAVRFRELGRRALESGDPAAIRKALSHYRGELLAGEAPGRWIDEHRERLRRLHVDLTLALATRLEEEDPEAAQELYRGLAAREELDEEIHRRYMKSLVRSGDRVGALRHYGRLVDLLRHALDADPEEETRKLYHEIRRGAES